MFACTTTRDTPPPCGTAATVSTGQREQPLGVARAPGSGGHVSTAGEIPWRRSWQSPRPSRATAILSLPSSVRSRGVVGEHRYFSRWVVCSTRTDNSATRARLPYSPRRPVALRRARALVDMDDDAESQIHQRAVGMAETAGETPWRGCRKEQTNIDRERHRFSPFTRQC